MDTDYGIGMSLRQWFFSSSIIGLTIFTLQFIIVLWKICFPRNKKCPQALTITNIILFMLKFLGYNTLGFVVEGNIDSNDLADCDSGIKAYMEALFII